MDWETRILGGKCGSQGITALYPYLRYNGASTNEADLYMSIFSFMPGKPSFSHLNSILVYSLGKALLEKGGRGASQ